MLSSQYCRIFSFIVAVLLMIRSNDWCACSVLLCLRPTAVDKDVLVSTKHNRNN